MNAFCPENDEFYNCDNVCFVLLTQLIDDFPKDPKVKELVDKYDWYLLPVVNPDGYSYTLTTVTEFVKKSFC